MKKFYYIAVAFTSFIASIAFLSLQSNNSGETVPPADSLKVSNQINPVHGVETPGIISFAGETAPLNLFYVHEYLDRDLIVNTYFHSSTLLLLKRANRWFPVIEPILKQNNIPDDFKYLAMIESGFENVTSPSGAKGFWQFLKHTAREHGLEVNNGIDERYNVEKSTVAACKYFRKSYERFNNWTLVAAAYNAGNRSISDELASQLVDNYYDLRLSAETERYVFRILAVKTIMQNPENHGFFLEQEELYPPIPTKVITVNKTISNLVDFANQHRITYKTLKFFNPWMLLDYLPDQSGRIYHIKIPLEGYDDYEKLQRAADIFD